MLAYEKAIHYRANQIQNKLRSPLNIYNLLAETRAIIIIITAQLAASAELLHTRRLTSALVGGNILFEAMCTLFQVDELVT